MYWGHCCNRVHHGKRRCHAVTRIPWSELKLDQAWHHLLVWMPEDLAVLLLWYALPAYDEPMTRLERHRWTGQLRWLFEHWGSTRFATWVGTSRRSAAWVLFHDACGRGEVAFAAELTKTFSLTHDARSDVVTGALVEACNHGHLDVIRFLFGPEIGLTLHDARYTDALEAACKHGHLNVVQFLFHNVGFTRQDARTNRREAIRLTCRHDHVPVLTYLFGPRVGLTIDDVRQCVHENCRSEWFTRHLRWLFGVRENLTAEELRYLRLIGWSADSLRFLNHLRNELAPPTPTDSLMTRAINAAAWVWTVLVEGVFMQA